MPEKPEHEDAPAAVAPGYPAIETLRPIDVSGWEPAAVFRPVVESPGDSGQGGRK